MSNFWVSKPPPGVGIDWGHPHARDLVGCWLLNEGTGDTVWDLSGNGNTGTLTNMDPATDWTNSSRGAALDFDGANDFVDLGGSSVLQPGYCSLAASFSTVNTGTQARGYMLYRWRLGGFWLTVGDTGAAGKVQWYGYAGGDAWSITSTGAYNDGAMHTAIGTHSGAAQNLWVDGINTGTPGTKPGVVEYGAGRAAIGRAGGYAENYFVGVIGWVMLWSRPLSSIEAIALTAAPYAMFRPPASKWAMLYVSGIEGQTLLPGLIASAEALYQPSVNPGAVSLLPGLIGTGEATLEPLVVPGGVSVIPGIIPTGQATFGPIIAPGAVSLLPGIIGTGEAVSQPTILPGAVTILPGLIASGEVLLQPTLAVGSITVAPGIIGTGAAVFEPVVSLVGVQTILPGLIASGQAVYAPTITEGGAYVLVTTDGTVWLLTEDGTLWLQTADATVYLQTEGVA